jgi:Tfp pilus assembly protein PilV
MKKRGFPEKEGWIVEASMKDRGVTLVETMIAVLVALIGVFSLGSLIFQATVTNKNQGTEVTRATIYAQDKMEKLLSMGAAGAVSTATANFATCNQTATTNPAICDTSATWTVNAAVTPPTVTATAGITGTGWNTGLVAGGALAPMQTTCPTAAPSLGYVDFLDSSGNVLPKTAGACSSITTPTAYIRMWQIQDVTTGGPPLKQISVAVWSMAAVGPAANKPVVLLTSYLSNPN